MTPRNKILAIVKKNLGEEYKQVRNTFYRFYDELFQVIEVQFLRTGTQKTAVTIYFGVLVPKIFEILWKTKFSINDYKKVTVHNGVFKCNINDLITDFKGKPRIKYWDLNDDEDLFLEIDSIVKIKLVPFIRDFNSLQELNKIIDEVQYPTKNSTDVPVSRLALKYILNENDQFYKLAEHLKLSNNHFTNIVDDLLKMKMFE